MRLPRSTSTPGAATEAAGLRQSLRVPGARFYEAPHQSSVEKSQVPTAFCRRAMSQTDQRLAGWRKQRRRILVGSFRGDGGGYAGVTREPPRSVRRSPLDRLLLFGRNGCLLTCQVPQRARACSGCWLSLAWTRFRRIEARVPRFWRRVFRDFAGLKETAMYNMLRDGQLRYIKLLARRPGNGAA